MTANNNAESGRHSPGAPLPGELGRGPLGRFSLVAHWVLVLSFFFVLASVPTLTAVAILDNSLSNAPLAVLCFIPTLPAITATLFAWRTRGRDSEASPMPSFFKGYRVTWLDSLRIGVPAVLIVTMLTWTLLNLGALNLPSGYSWFLIGVGVIFLVIAVIALVISTFYNFRFRDTWRLATHYAFRKPLVSVAILASLICLVALTWATNELVVALAGGVICALLLSYCKPILDVVEAQHVKTGHDQDS